MTTRRVDYLISDVRTSTENEDFSDYIGIGDDEFLRFLNDAQSHLQAKIIHQHPNVFLYEKELNIVSGQEAYDLPANIYLGNKVVQVEYSYSGNSDDYYPLKIDLLKNRSSDVQSDPTHYSRRSNQILLRPVPTSGTLRVTYVRKVPKLDLIRGTVSAVTLDSSTSTITSLFLDVATSTIDTTELNKHVRISVCNDEGTVQMTNIKFSSIDETTGEITIDPAFTYLSGETISVGDNVVAGAFSSTHSELDDTIERYLIAYATAKILHRDSSADISAQMQILMQMESDIVSSYAEIDDDVYEIPEIIDINEWDYI